MKKQICGCPVVDSYTDYIRDGYVLNRDENIPYKFVIRHISTNPKIKGYVAKKDCVSVKLSERATSGLSVEELIDFAKEVLKERGRKEKPFYVDKRVLEDNHMYQYID